MCKLLQIFLILSACGFIYLSSACYSFKKKESVILECKLPGTRQITNCYSGDLPQGTALTYKCSPNYIPVNVELKSGQLNCGNRNRWSGLDRYETFSCSIDCGRQFEELAPLVVGGVSANRHDFPWHASIYVRQSEHSPFRYACGGSLVKPYSKGFVIISAAHCLANGRGEARDPQNVKMLLGANYSNWEENDGIPNLQQHQAKQIVIHESYSGRTSYFQADIALLTVKDPIAINTNVLPACFSGGNDFAEIGAIGTVVGFGAYQYDNSTVSKTLRMAELPVVKKDKCFEWRERKLLPSEICAGFLMSQSACNGDSGGGYVFSKTFNKVERFYLEGIVSHGRKNPDNLKEGCDSYSVFTNVPSYDTWIREKAEEMLSEDLGEEEDNSHASPSEVPLERIRTTTSRSRPTNLRPTSPSVHENPQPDIMFVSPKPQPPQKATTLTTHPSSSPIIFEPPNSNNNDFKSVGLKRHNYYRRRHGSPDVRLTDTLNRHAQDYADKLIREGGTLKNEYEDGINKNVYKHISAHVTDPTKIIRGAVESWYSAVRNYNWNNPQLSTFSQVVWRTTTDIGVGISSSNRGEWVSIVVVSYSPGGNVEGENGKYFKENVFPLQNPIE